ncbi:proline iminopeptidase-family hydrolase [Fulvivirgaceae bacterium PWU4]|uniref:Proline iminopeptidase-family hydrolase n=1 Tax=Chryseosolibacter histidini TaxID=2782349 RepID=A0AAP2GGW5_9BACT|nr:proline iminopeptidase-family hydrolase [Chryseosolibacter histidini]MBT1695361.1 proline iminopeptidase-family hydrolase [Chryseosolibacter histidini]
MKNLIISATILLLLSCQAKNDLKDEKTSYLDLRETGVKSAGIKMIPVHNGAYKVWTKRIGNNPRMKVLLLHGGPAATHEYFESFESFFPQEGIEFYYYDQLGSYYSDQPTDSSLWTTARFVEEVEEVRKALQLDNSNFYLLGNSWGGILAMEYALKYQQNLKGLIICNMMASCPDYGKYADEVLAKQFEPSVLQEIRAIEAKKDFSNPRYMELLMPNFYEKHLCRFPASEMPDPVNRTFKHLNPTIYTLMQGPSEFGISGRLEKWDIKARLPEITVPTLTVGATHDTMDPKHMEWMSTQVKKGHFLLCPEGSHMSMWDDQQHFFPGVVKFIKAVDNNSF